jgi:hypothetical protein
MKTTDRVHARRAVAWASRICSGRTPGRRFAGAIALLVSFLGGFGGLWLSLQLTLIPMLLLAKR